VNKNPTDATVCRYLFTAKLLYMFRVSQHPSSGVLKTVPAASSTGHTTCTTTPVQRGLIRMQPFDHPNNISHRVKIMHFIIVLVSESSCYILSPI